MWTRADYQEEGDESGEIASHDACDYSGGRKIRFLRIVSHGGGEMAWSVRADGWDGWGENRREDLASHALVQWVGVQESVGHLPYLLYRTYVHTQASRRTHPKQWSKSASLGSGPASSFPSGFHAASQTPRPASAVPTGATYGTFYVPTARTVPSLLAYMCTCLPAGTRFCSAGRCIGRYSPPCGPWRRVVICGLTMFLAEAR